jgi:hypothetical protein
VDVKAKDAELEQLKTWHHRDVMKMKDLKEKVQQMLADRELRMVEERRKQEAESNALLEDERCVRAPVHSDGNSPATRPHDSATARGRPARALCERGAACYVGMRVACQPPHQRSGRDWLAATKTSSQDPLSISCNEIPQGGRLGCTEHCDASWCVPQRPTRLGSRVKARFDLHWLVGYKSKSCHPKLCARHEAGTGVLRSNVRCDARV